MLFVSRSKLVVKGRSSLGFSIMELTVSLGVVGAILFGAYHYLADMGDSYERIRDRREDVVMNSQKLFSRMFLEVMGRSGLSLSYVYLFVPFAKKCSRDGNGVQDGGCFFSVNSAGELFFQTESDTYQAILLTEQFSESLNDNIQGRRGLNVFGDEILSKHEWAYEEQTVRDVNWHLVVPIPARFKRSVIRAQDQRHYVGWSLKTAAAEGEDPKTPFYVMTASKSASSTFSMTVNRFERSISPPDDEENKEFLLFLEEPIITKAAENDQIDQFMKPYQNRFYLVVLSSDPRIHYVTRISEVTTCSNSNLDFGAPDDLKEDCVIDNPPNLETPHSRQVKFVAKDCKEEDDCLKFFDDFIRESKAMNKTFPFNNSDDQVNLFHFNKPSLRHNNCEVDRDLLINPAHHLHTLKECSSVPPWTSESDKLIFIPIQFYKFYLEKSDDGQGSSTKKLVVESDEWLNSEESTMQLQGAPDEELQPTINSRRRLFRKRDLIKGLDMDDQIIFGRRIGSSQFSAFLYKKFES